MSDPKGRKPADPAEPRIDDAAPGPDMPMYANDPAEPAAVRGEPSFRPEAAARPGGMPGATSRGGGSGPSGAPAAGAPAAGSAAAGSPAAGSAGGSAAEAGMLARELAEARAALAAAEAKAAEHYEALLRATAEMENVRRRAKEDVSKAHKYAIESFAESMVPVRDSLEMALTVATPTLESLREGVEATLRQLVQAFERNRVIVIDPVNQKFDPNHHQAISMVPSKTVPANHVVAVLQKGYLINDRILRPALVTVSQGG